MPTKITKTDTPVDATQEVTIDQEVDDFDIDAWMDGATQPSRSVIVYRDAGARAEFDELEHQYRKLNAGRAQQSSDDARGEATLADVTDYDGQLMEIADRMQEVYERLEQGALTIKVRGATEDEHADAAAAAGTSKDSGRQFIYELLARVAVQPANLSPEKWQQMRNRIGMKQFDLVVDAMNDACGFGGSDGVMPGFSPSALAGLATKHS